jgi:CDP-diacylglycerol--glycerol-3-phosphate 3-phosphatidyltransferase
MGAVRRGAHQAGGPIPAASPGFAATAAGIESARRQQVIDGGGYRKPHMWNIPNSLTMLRILMAPLLVVVLLTEVPDKEFWGLGIFLFAALTDLLDGIIARRTNRITVVGAMLDPIADKLLMAAAFISLVELGLAPAWMVFTIIAREFAVTGLRLVALERKVAISANAWGKAKTASQIVAVSLLILGQRIGSWSVLSILALWVALALTMVSLVIYLVQNWKVVAGPAE